MSTVFLNELPKKSKTAFIIEQKVEGMVSSRHHIFSSYHKFKDRNPREIADNVLMSRFKKGDLDQSQVIGVDAELAFYHEFKDELNLVPALDCGDHTDFVGMWEGKLIRFDITTNLSYKKPEDYIYKEYHIVAVWDNQNNDCEYYYVEDGAFKLVNYSQKD